MFSTEQLIDDCRVALGEAQPCRAVRDIVARAVAAPGEVLRAVGTPTQAGLLPVYRSSRLTILNVVWAPNMSIFPHDHRMWAVIGLYGGAEDNVFYRRTAAGMARASAKRLETGETALLGERTVHAVVNPMAQFTGAIHVYGGDFFAAVRSEFDPQTLKERPFDIERAKQVFEEANRRLQ